jgi:hypothetical protein
VQLAHRPYAIPSRWVAFLGGLGPLVLIVLFGTLATFVVTEAAVVLVALAAITFVAWPIALWVLLFRGAKTLDAGLASHLAGDSSAAVPGAIRVLWTVMRADLRTRALHLLALSAEERGDFAHAAELFARTEQALPAMAAPIHKAAVRVLAGSHRAMCLALSGRVAEARDVLARVQSDFARSGIRGWSDDFLDDSKWGVGAVSMNEMLLKIEGHRDPRAVITLAWIVVHHARGAPSDLLDVVAHEGAVLSHGLLPREHALVERLCAEARAAQGAGVWRSPAQLPAPSHPWVDLVVEGAAMARPAR